MWGRVLEAASPMFRRDSELIEAIAAGRQCAGMAGRPSHWQAALPVLPVVSPAWRSPPIIGSKTLSFGRRPASPLQVAGTDNLTHVFNSSAPTPWQNVTARSTVGGCWPPLSSQSVESKCRRWWMPSEPAPRAQMEHHHSRVVSIHQRAQHKARPHKAGAAIPPLTAVAALLWSTAATAGRGASRLVVVGVQCIAPCDWCWGEEKGREGKGYLCPFVPPALARQAARKPAAVK